MEPNATVEDDDDMISVCVYTNEGAEHLDVLRSANVYDVIQNSLEVCGFEIQFSGLEVDRDCSFEDLGVDDGGSLSVHEVPMRHPGCSSH